MNRRLSPLPPTTIPHSFVLGTTVINNNNYDLGLANIGYMLKQMIRVYLSPISLHSLTHSLSSS
jgi:hypothetical protein